MAKYSVEQKTEAVRLYTVMANEGTCYFNKEAIHNIRALCKALNISSQSLYRWAEEFTDVIYLDKDDLKRDDDLEVLGFEGEGDFIPDFSIEDREMREAFSKEEVKPMTFKMGTTFFQTLAQGLGIKKYRMPLKQLYLNIGTELIKMSGLVENGVREELRLE